MPLCLYIWPYVLYILLRIYRWLNLTFKRIDIQTSLELLSELGCAGRGHVLWEGVSGDLGTGQGQSVDQGVVQKLVLLL